MRAFLAGLFLLLLPSAAFAACSGNSLTLQTVSGNVTVCMGGASAGYWSQQQLVDSNNAVLDSAAGTTNPGGRAIAVQGISSGVAVPISAAALPLPSNAVQETGGNVASINTEIGALGSSAASADTGSFNLNAMIQRLNQHLTTINTTLGTPLQAGGAITGTVNGGGTAGTANAGVMTVQGIASMTPLLINPGTATSWGIYTQGSTTSGQSGSLIQGAVTTSAPTYTTAQTSPLSLDTSGNLRVTLSSGSITSNVTQINSNTISTAANGTQLVGIEGHAGNTLDVTIGGATAPTNALVSGLEFLSVLPTLTTGQAAGLQGDSSARLIISPTNLSVAQASTTSGQTGDLVMGAATTSAPSYTNGQTNPLSLDLSGNVRVNCAVGCSTSSFLDTGSFTQGTTPVQPIAGLYTTSVTNLTSGQAGAVRLTTDRMMFTNLGDVGGSAIALGQTTMSASLPVVLPSNQAAIPINSNGATGSAVPSNADYNGINVAGNLRGATGVNPTGTVYAQQMDLASVNGTTQSTGTGAQGAGTPRVTVATDTATIAGSAPGTAGTASSNVLSVQGIASMTPMEVSPTTSANAIGNPFFNQAVAVSGNTNSGYAYDVTSDPTVTASAYTANQCLGGFTSVTVAGNNAQSGWLSNIMIESGTGLTPTITFYVFDANPSLSTCTDHGTFTLNVGDLDKLITEPFSVTLAASPGQTPSEAEASFAPMRPFLASGVGGAAKTIYIGMTTSAITPASTTEFKRRVGVAMN